MTRVAALDRRVDPGVIATASVLGSALGVAAALGFLAGRITHRRSTP